MGGFGAGAGSGEGGIVADAGGKEELPANFFVGNDGFLARRVKGEAAQMHEQREDVVSRREGREVVSKA